MITLVHNKVELALHELRADGDGRPLLLLHGLAERSPSSLPPELEGWPGPVFALDFTGHGASTLPVGGGYSAEVLMADASTAVDRLGQVTVLGRGLGAYVALLLAGARAPDVRGAILADGPGLTGGGPMPASTYIYTVADTKGPPDPFALAELAHDVRPPDYASSFVRQATHLSGLAEPIAVTALVRPDWLRAIVSEPGVHETKLARALEMYA